MGVDEKYIIDNIVTYTKFDISLRKLLMKQLNHSKYIFNHFYSFEINMYMMSQ